MENQDGESKNNIKSLSITPAITALLEPTAKYLGQEIREYVKENVEEWKKKRRARNLDSHLDAVREKLTHQASSGIRYEPTLERLVLFDEWIDKAQEIDPDEKELSEIWRNLLVTAARGESIPSEVVAALKSISPREAQFLTKMDRRRPTFFSPFVSQQDRYLAILLETKRILEKDYSFLLAFLATFVIAGVLLFIKGPSYFGMLHFDLDISAKLTLVVAVVIFMIPFINMIGLMRWKFTWLGYEMFEVVSDKRTKAHNRSQKQSGTD